MPLASEIVPTIADSALALRAESAEPGATLALGERSSDSLLYVDSGSGRLRLGSEEHPLGSGSAALVLAGEEAQISAEADLSIVVATVSGDLERADAERASGSRAFQIFFGPDNGSTRATLFAGFIPPGRAPWHYHLYDEIVWVPDGPGRLHLGDTTVDLERGSAFRLRPRQVHIVENLSRDTEMTIIGVFTPAGSPSAAYLTPEVAAEYLHGR